MVACKDAVDEDIAYLLPRKGRTSSRQANSNAPRKVLASSVSESPLDGIAFCDLAQRQVEGSIIDAALEDQIIRIRVHGCNACGNTVALTA